MNTPLLSQPRGRGFRASTTLTRGHSKNKQWIAPSQDTRGNLGGASATSSGEAGGTSGNDATRWERGGGPRRGGGRARGRGLARGQYSNLSGRPHQQQLHSTSASTLEVSESGSMSDATEQVAQFEPPDIVDDEPVLETQEERDKFYQELVAVREVERQHAIATGKMDDPNVAKRLEDAITMVGTCMDMCPRFERYQRERQHQLDKWELIPGTKRVDHRRAVKRYQRAAGDRVIPSDLRPAPVLKKTLDYLFHTLMPSAPFHATAFFIRDRSRAVRNDFTIQYDTGPLAVECHERCARFHAISMHLMAGRADFDLSMEVVGLKNTLQSLKEFYDDRHGQFPLPHELEMRIYHRLIHIRDTKPETLPPHISSNSVFQLVTKFRSQVQVASPVITKNSELKVDAKAMEVFGEMVAALKEYYSKGEDGRGGSQGERRSRRVMYLVACIMEGVFGQGVVDDVEGIKGDLTVQDVIDGNDGFDEEGEAGAFEVDSVEDTGMEDGEGEIEEEFDEESADQVEEQMQANTVPGWGSTNMAPPIATQSQQRPVQSAFSNLTSNSNVFGGGQSAFGITFPVSASPPVVSAFSQAAPRGPPSQLVQQAQRPSMFGAPLGSFGQPQSSAVPSTIMFNPPGLSTATASVPQNSTPPRPSGLNPTAPAFTPPSISAWDGKPSLNIAPPLSSLPPVSTPPQPPQPNLTPQKLSTAPPLSAAPTLPADTFALTTNNPVAALGAAPTLPAGVFNPVATTDTTTTPGTSNSPFTTHELFAPSHEHTGPHLVDRKQTLWDLPSTTPASIADLRSLAPPKANGRPSITTDGVSFTPPPLDKPAPLALPPTPTARWFDPSSSNGIVKSPGSSVSTPSPTKPQSSSLALRKQSLGIVGLQIPGVPTSAEILSPLTLGTARIEFPSAPTTAQSSPTPLGPVASTSRSLLTDFKSEPDGFKDANTTPTTSPEKGKARATDMDTELDIPTHAQMRATAAEFVRRGSVVKKCFNKWRKKLEDSIKWEEACRRSDTYKAKVQRRRLSDGSRDLKRRRLSADDLNTTTSRSAQKRRRPRLSAQYAIPVTDAELVKRLKENQEEQQRRWAQGSFLSSVRSTLLNRLHDEGTSNSHTEYPLDWSVWLSFNTENDSTAIWMERKFNVPESGGWVSENVFSIPLDREGVPPGPSSVTAGSPGLIVFERTPLGDLNDPIEQKYRVLDDCARLRDVIEQLQSVSALRYTPTLVVVTWADTDGPDAAPDFGDMIRALLDEKVIQSAQNVVISAKETNWDTRFDEALTHTKLDIHDKSVIRLTWQDLCNLYLPSFKTHASDWLHSCWTNDQFDWSRYGDVMRSLEHLQAALAREILTLLQRPPALNFSPVDLQTPSHLDTAYANGAFLNGFLNQTTVQIEEALGKILPSYALPRDLVGSSRHRFEEELSRVSERLRQLAALSLSSRSLQKRRAEDGSDVGSPTSTNKRLKVSPTPTVSDHTVEIDGDTDHDMDGFLTPPPLSTAPSTIVPNEAASKPQVTIAMLRSLAQGVLKSTR